MIDTHCHIDLYKNPLQVIHECESLGIITIGMTNLPSHFEIGYRHVLPFKKVRLALGMHPLYAKYHKNEFNQFIKSLSKTSYIGEIGLDFSREGFSTKEIQIESFVKILNEIKGKNKILSLHSRRAEKEVLEYLLEYNIKSAIFHWYSGSLSLIDKIAEAGYYFSINSAMIESEHGQKIIKKIPIENLLTETDGPFILSKNNQPIKPCDLGNVYDYLAQLHHLKREDIGNIIKENFLKLISILK